MRPRGYLPDLSILNKPSLAASSRGRFPKPGDGSFRAIKRLLMALLLCLSTQVFPQQRFLGVWQESEKKERVLGDASAKTFEDTYRSLLKKGFLLTDIEVVDQGGQKKYYGVWHSGSDSCAIYADSWEPFLARSNDLNTKGLRLIDIETFAEGKQRKYVGAWRKDSYTERLQAGLAWPEFYKVWEQNKKDGLVLIDVETYLDERERKFIGVWKSDGRESNIWKDLDWKTFAVIHKGLQEQKFQLIDLETYTTDNERKFMGVWVKSPGEQRMVVDANWTEYMNQWEEIGKDNLWLIDLEVY